MSVGLENIIKRFDSYDYYLNGKISRDIEENRKGQFAMKREKTVCKKNSTSKLFKTILSLVMVFSLLMSCSLIFTGCGQDSDDESTGKPNNDDKNNASKYEGLKEEEYLQALESDNLGALVDALGEVYDAFLEGAGSSSPADLSSGAKMDLTLRLGDDLLDMLESLKSKRILSGTFTGLEEQGSSGRNMAVIYHGSIKVVIPAHE